MVTASVVGQYGSIAWDVVTTQYILFFMSYSVFQAVIMLIWFPDVVLQSQELQPLVTQELSAEAKIRKLRLDLDSVCAQVVSAIFGVGVLLYAVNSNCAPLEGVYSPYTYACNPSYKFLWLCIGPVAALVPLAMFNCFMNRTAALWLMTVCNTATMFTLVDMSFSQILVGFPGAASRSSAACPPLNQFSVLLVALGAGWALHILLVPLLLVCGAAGIIGGILALILAFCCRVVVDVVVDEATGRS